MLSFAFAARRRLLEHSEEMLGKVPLGDYVISLLLHDADPHSSFVNTFPTAFAARSVASRLLDCEVAWLEAHESTVLWLTPSLRHFLSFTGSSDCTAN